MDVAFTVLFHWNTKRQQQPRCHISMDVHLEKPETKLLFRTFYPPHADPWMLLFEMKINKFVFSLMYVCVEKGH